VSANLDLVRSIYADWERGDFSSAEWAHPEIEFAIADGPEPARWTGVAGMAKGWRSRLSTWEQYRIGADEFRPVHDERVLVLDYRVGRGKRSGLDVGQLRTQGATVFRVRDGKVTEIVAYWQRDRAFAELGLTPEGH
jgi:ketosteroid isomerase-like protein